VGVGVGRERGASRVGVVRRANDMGMGVGVGVGMRSVARLRMGSRR
jgi:hypothetical protein